jgi:hypothetical protein
MRPIPNSMKPKSIQSDPRKRALTGLLVAAAISAVGCAHLGGLILEINLGVEVSTRTPNGQSSPSAPSDFSREPVSAQSPTKFPAVLYRGKIFSSHFAVGGSISGGNLGLGSRISTRIRSNLTEPVCFRFDQASLSSNFHAQPIPLRINWSKLDAKPLFPDQPTYGAAYVPSRQCFTEESRSFDFGPDVEALFPNRSIFNIKLKENSSALSETGRGNWLRLHIPVEYGSTREEIEITLTVLGSDTTVRIY